MKIRYILFILPLLAVLFFIADQTNMFKVVIVQSDTMMPSYKHKQWVVVSDLKKFKPNDVCYVRTAERVSILRIAGMEGDTVEINDGYLLRNGSMFDDPNKVSLNYFISSSRYNNETAFDTLLVKPYHKGDSIIFCLNYNEYKRYGWYYYLHRVPENKGNFVDEKKIIVPENCCLVVSDNRDFVGNRGYFDIVPLENVIATVL